MAYQLQLRNHEQRMEALEYAFDTAHTGLERAQIVQLAAQLEREYSYAECAASVVGQSYITRND